MTVDVSLPCTSVKVAVEVKQLSAGLFEDSPEINYCNGVNEQQLVVEPDGCENSCGEGGAPRCAPVAGVTKIPDSHNACKEMGEQRPFCFDETIFIFDWDDTLLPSTWVQQQGLRLDDASELTDTQRQELSEVADKAMETMRIAKQLGTVVLVTNAERGWIELSCQKFLPTLFPVLENVKLMSARTSYESMACVSPMDWKIQAFNAEIRRVFGDDAVCDPTRRKNCLSLGDSNSEREALLRVTAALPNCRSKSLKFVERPELSDILKQHSLIIECLDGIAQHDGNIDVCIRCA